MLQPLIYFVQLMNEWMNDGKVENDKNKCDLTLINQTWNQLVKYVMKTRFFGF
jgi:hypothetical protein